MWRLISRCFCLLFIASPFHVLCGFFFSKRHTKKALSQNWLSFAWTIYDGIFENHLARFLTCSSNAFYRKCVGGLFFLRHKMMAKKMNVQSRRKGSLHKQTDDNKQWWSDERACIQFTHLIERFECDLHAFVAHDLFKPWVGKLDRRPFLNAFEHPFFFTV